LLIKIIAKSNLQNSIAIKMFRFSFCLLSLFCFVAAHENSSTFIANGKDAAPGQFKYFASLRIVFGIEIPFCGANILSSKWLVTASHCVEQISQFYVIVGSTSLLEEGSRYEVEKVVMHPLYRQVDWYWINE
jgi:secreted trypsin-like serine protease